MAVPFPLPRLEFRCDVRCDDDVLPPAAMAPDSASSAKAPFSEGMAAIAETYPRVSTVCTGAAKVGGVGGAMGGVGGAGSVGDAVGGGAGGGGGAGADAGAGAGAGVGLGAGADAGAGVDVGVAVGGAEVCRTISTTTRLTVAGPTDS